MSRFVNSLEPYTYTPEENNTITTPFQQETSPTFKKSSSIPGITHKKNNQKAFTQSQTLELSSPPPGTLFNQLTNYPETEEMNSQNWLPELSNREKWDLEGFFQTVYALSVFAFPPDVTPWETYSPLLVDAFFKAADDEDQLFTDNVLILAFQNCSDVFATHYEWPEYTKAEVFAQHTTGKEALVAILQLVKLAKGFGIDGEEWWELRYNLCKAFAQPFQRNGWVSQESDIFHKLFTQSLKIFLDLGVMPGTWTFTVLGSLNAWRKVKETQEAVAEERISVALKTRTKFESAWDTLRTSINGDRDTLPAILGPPLGSDPDPSPDARLRIKPLPNPRQHSPPALSIPLGTPLKSQPLTPNTTPEKAQSYDDTTSALRTPGNNLAKKQNYTLFPITPTSPDCFDKEFISSLGDINDPSFGDLPDLDFGDYMDLDWNDSGVFSNGDLTDPEGPESQSTEEQISEKAYQWSGKQLWEMTDEQFGEFCSQSPPWR